MSTEKLLAIESIKQLKARYFRYVDLKLWDELENLFTEDVSVEFEEFGLSLSGRKEFVEAIRLFLTDAVSTHYGYMPEIEITSDTEATGIWAMTDHIWFGPGRGRSHLAGHGYYFEEYEKSVGDWRIRRMQLVRLSRCTASRQVPILKGDDVG